MRKYQIAVIGHNAELSSKKTNNIAYRVGKAIAESGSVLICGGLNGVMEHACKGAKDNGGITIGIIPQDDFSFANEFCDIVIATGIGLARDFIVSTSADGIIVVGGGVGTLIELCVAYELKKTIVAITNSGGTAERYSGKYIDNRKMVMIIAEEDPELAVETIIKNCRRN